jgi:hypothetical protein
MAADTNRPTSMSEVGRFTNISGNKIFVGDEEKAETSDKGR